MDEYKNQTPRPIPGDIIIKEIKYPICKECGFLVGETGGCAYGCPKDYDHYPKKDIFYAVYKQSMEFLRDENVE